MPAPPLPPEAPPSLREQFSALRNVPPFLRDVWQTSPTLSVLSLVLRGVEALIPVAMLYVGKLIIDEAVHLAPQVAGVGAAEVTFTHLLWLLAAEFALAILQDLLSHVTSHFDAVLSEMFSNRTSIRLMEHAATLDLEDFEDSELQDQLERARRQTMGRMTLLGQLLGEFQNIITIISFAAGLLIYAPWLMLLLAVAMLPSFLGESRFNALEYALNHRRATQRRQLEYLRQLGSGVEFTKEVKIFGLNDFLIDRFRSLSATLLAENRKLSRQHATWAVGLSAFGTLAYYGAYAWIAWRTAHGQFSIGDLTFLAGSFRTLNSQLETLLAGFSGITQQALFLDDLYSFYAIKPEIVSKPDAVPVPRPIRQGFVFEDVGFRYEGSEHWAIRHLSFTLHAGEVIALVGENGAGKTTLVKLLARLYDPDEGRILLDGRDLRDYDLDDLRANIGVIFQDFVRYHMTAAENIGMGQISAMDDLARIKDAAHRGMADEVIDSLPKGYDQIVGKRFKKGVDLSGGQWQKIAIARAYMRDAQVMILDEPTAALDARAEFEVFQRFKELSEDKTAVLISHRFSSVRMADRILVLGGGRVEASGTHDELMAQGGRYAELFELQAAGYR